MRDFTSTGVYLASALKTRMERPDMAANKHWLARVTLGLWALHIPLIAFLAPASIVGRAVERAGLSGFLFMFVLAVMASVAIVDSLVNGAFPSRYTVCMMNQRHMGFMGMAACLVIAGAGIVHKGNGPAVVMLSFLIPAALCVVVTFLDLHLRHKERLPAP